MAFVPPGVPQADRAGTVAVVYVLYLVGLVVGVTSLIAVVVAYVYRNDAPAWAQTHYDFQIRTFWIGMLYALIGVLLALVVIGWVVLVFAVVWLVVRCVRGLKFASDGRPHPDPMTWLW